MRRLVRGGADSGAVAFGHRAGAFLGTAAGIGLGWGWFEAGWVRLRELELEVPGLPFELDGLRIVHLSDFHLGVPSRGLRAVERGVDWAAERRPDLVCITGDLLTHPRGEPRLRSLVERLPRPAFAVLGNHDYAIARDPQAKASNLRELEPARLLFDEGELLELRGRSVWVAGVDPRLILRRGPKTDPNSLSREADFRILLCHFPRVFDRLGQGLATNFDNGFAFGMSTSISSPFGLAYESNPNVRSISSSPGTCTTDRSQCRIRAERCGSPTRRHGTRPVCTAARRP